MQGVQLFGDPLDIGFRRCPFDPSPHFLNIGESVAASGALEIVPEAPDRTKVASRQTVAGFLDLFLFGRQILSTKARTSGETDAVGVGTGILGRPLLGVA
jgi:hypothetical protein